MPRKDFRFDLAAVVRLSQFNNISNVADGEDDGEFTFQYQFHLTGENVQISALIPDVSEYPKSHDFHLFTTDQAPIPVASALQETPNLRGQTLQLFLPRLSDWLDSSTTKGKQTSSSIDADGDSEMLETDFQDQDDSDTNVGEDWFDDDELFGNHSATTRQDDPLTRTGSGATARADLRATKTAGFKIGAIGTISPTHSCYISVSCRISKLGISDEALDAWNLNPRQYLILLIYYPFGYLTFDNVKAPGAGASKASFQVRTGVSHTYKPMSIIEAQGAFKDHRDGAMLSTQHQKNKSEPEAGQEDECDTSKGGSEKTSARGFQETFISRPLNSLINERFLFILRLRLSNKLSWGGAERLYEKLQRDSSKLARSEEGSEVNETAPHALSSLVTADELKDQAGDQRSFALPLLTMQFALRHFVRSTEFCLICHCRLPPEIEAIKPYVCDNSLCLFQYMNLGFGPSLEHEILTQPYVVDILISFCYSAAASHQLKSYPEGLGWNFLNPSVVDVRPYPRPAQSTSMGPPAQPSTQKSSGSQSSSSSSLSGHLRTSMNEILFDTSVYPRSPLRVGSWAMIKLDANTTWHARVSDTMLFPTIKLNDPIIRPCVSSQSRSSKTASTSPESIKVELHVYDFNFDELTKQQMDQGIQMLLDIMPSVAEMYKYLTAGHSRRLDQWIARMNPSSLGLLRWIVASNRSCIMQVDRPKFMATDTVKKRAEERVSGVPEWLQFRFAMGAPDKEQRFINAISQHGDPGFKTIFAWHGSSLENWHSIIREGLRFDKVTNGRAFGNGCYLAKDFTTSKSYSNRGYAGRQHDMSDVGLPSSWSQSILEISSAIALSEIVNAPFKFISQQPYYVLDQLDWIQTRYLFVHPQANDLPKIGEIQPTRSLNQDPNRIPRGPNSTHIVLPLTAIPKSRRSLQGVTPHASRGLARLGNLFRGEGSSPDRPVVIEDDDDDDGSASVVTLSEDREMLLEPEQKILPPPTAKKVSSEPLLEFDPCPILNLPSMPLPTDAAPAASQRLQRDLRKLLDTQYSHVRADTLSDIGWYMDPEHIVRTSNLFQWVVELHSFPLNLPLANDLKKAGMQSVILEIRFPATYPFSPPFVRIVRPRFLMFSQGGGGHVTSGGSICMDLLTASGWTAANDIESVLLQIRVALMSTTPVPARLESVSKKHGGRSGDYGVLEAVEAFRRVANAHGWKVPDSLAQVALSGGSDTAAGRSG